MRRLAVLASISPEGAPQSALVGIAATSDLEVVFDTVKSTRKYRNLVANPSCSFVIGWTGEATVQYEGVARERNGIELTHYQETYFVVRPAWIRYSDFSRNPPHIEEFTIQ